jgi:outer membrane protein
MKKTALAILLGSALFAGSAVAHEAGSVIVRAGGVYVKANSSSTTQTVADVDLKVKNKGELGLTATYMLTDNLAVELLGATPFSHYITANVPALPAILGPSATPDMLGRVANVKHLPPSLYAQYYLGDAKSAIRPYIGAGLNYTRFYHAKSVNPLVTDLQVKKHSFGPVVNLGADIKLNDNLYFNMAAYYTRIKTTAKFKVPAIESAAGLPAGYTHKVKVKLDPAIFFTGLSYKF